MSFLNTFIFYYYHQILFLSFIFIGGSKRMENLALRCSITQAKIMGTIVSISGALVVVFYKGPTIISSSQSTSLSLHSPQGTSETRWVIGGLLLAASNLLFSGWYIVQVFLCDRWYFKLWIGLFECVLCRHVLSPTLPHWGFSR